MTLSFFVHFDIEIFVRLLSYLNKPVKNRKFIQMMGIVL